MFTAASATSWLDHKWPYVRERVSLMLRDGATQAEIRAYAETFREHEPAVADAIVVALPALRGEFQYYE